jgi:hypothetical protein
MLNREQLESLKEGIERGGVIYISIDDLEPLEDAAPKLALACLEARDLCLLILEKEDASEEIMRAAADVRSLLFNELQAAGVEVEP